jgi:endonuclease V-like protein UPF0215 family
MHLTVVELQEMYTNQHQHLQVVMVQLVIYGFFTPNLGV